MSLAQGVVRIGELEVAVPALALERVVSWPELPIPFGKFATRRRSRRMTDWTRLSNSSGSRHSRMPTMAPSRKAIR